MSLWRSIRDTFNSGAVARQRLHLAVAGDRSGISAQTLESMKLDLARVVAAYAESGSIVPDFRLESSRGQPALIAVIPLDKVRHR